VDLVVFERDVVLVDVVPLLNADLLRARAALRRHQLLQVAHCVILTVEQIGGVRGVEPIRAGRARDEGDWGSMEPTGGGLG